MSRNKQRNHQQPDHKKQTTTTDTEPDIISNMPSQEEVGNGVNSTPEEIKKLGGVSKLRARIKARRDAAKEAEQPKV
jgi:hypothetical protein